MDRTIKQQARLAGLLYFVMAIIAPFGLLYVPNKIFVTGNATATADHLRTSELLVRLGIASELGHQVINIFLVLALFRLFRAVDKMLAWQVVILGAFLPVPIVFLNVVSEIGSLILVSNVNYFSPAFTKNQIDALVMLFFRLHGQGLNIAQIFWGLWLFPFGLLVTRCGFIPKILGILLIVAGTSYCLDSSLIILFPHYQGVLNSVVSILILGELPIIFWLLIWGARGPRAHVALLSPDAASRHET